MSQIRPMSQTWIRFGLSPKVDWIIPSSSSLAPNNWDIYSQSHNWLVVEPNPLKNMTSSVGMMTFPIYGTIKHVPNHPPALNLSQVSIFTVFSLSQRPQTSVSSGPWSLLLGGWGGRGCHTGSKGGPGKLHTWGTLHAGAGIVKWLGEHND